MNKKNTKLPIKKNMFLSTESIIICNYFSHNDS